jgi:aminoglycoside phosphotransferase (APT) family kinase protein
MHEGEVEIDPRLVRRLLTEQFPHWAELPLERVPSSGTDNALFRLGDGLVVRLPRISWAVGGVEKDWRWLHELAPRLPVELPVPLARGRPGAGYEWGWGVYPWLAGENPRVGAIADPASLARDVARFVTALHAVDLPGGPAATRTGPLAKPSRDEPTLAAISDLRGTIDTDAATAAWEAALRAPEWDGPPVWVHTDLAPGNLLVADGRLTGVIDWSGVGVGDPAVDLIVAWNLLPPEARPVFRDELGVDEATWARGRGWALSVALIQLPYYRETNRPLAANAGHVIREVLADHV